MKLTKVYTLGALLLVPQLLLNAYTHEAFHDGMRNLWNDHGVWTREHVVASVAELPNVKLVEERLFKNQEDIGNALIPFYGPQAGKQLTALLKDHIKIAAAVVTAAKKGDTKALKEQDALWHKNAQDISAFLSKANPHLTEKAVTKLMNDHLAILTDVVTARIQKNWPRDIARYDAYRGQLNHMADTLSSAIEKQFPEKFEKKPLPKKEELPKKAAPVKPVKKASKL